MNISLIPIPIKHASLTALLALALLAPACDSVDEANPDLRALSASEQSVVGASNAFGLRLYAALADDAPDENLFISPTSVTFALGMAVNGAAGDTRDQMVETLGHASLSVEDLNTASKSLMEYLQGLDPLVQTDIANSIWHEATFTPAPAFIETNTTYYDAVVESLDFRAPASVDVINDWVADKTNDKIETIIDAIPDDAVMYLINAIYFKGSWKYQFDAAATQPEPFTGSDGAITQAPLMRMKATVPYQAGDDFASIDLPYGNGQYRMTVILPETTEDLPALIASLDDTKWARLVDDFDDQAVNIFLPRFTLEYKQTLNDALTALGIEDAFVEGLADFSGIPQDPAIELVISRVLHKTFVEVNEEGTEAAAVTAAEVSTTSYNPNEPREIFFRADRPFIYAIREAHSGAILFIGTLNTL
ncbi:MAG: serpin family protein [Rhodothermales bacterium]|nr:serpin family protein [Rhodothermales bacterium]